MIRGLNPRLGAFCAVEGQEVCLGTETTPIEKAKNKLDTVYILDNLKKLFTDFSNGNSDGAIGYG